MPLPQRLAHFSNSSIDSDSEGFKVSEMLDGTTGGLAVPPSHEKSDVKVQSVKHVEPAVTHDESKPKGTLKTHKKKTSKSPTKSKTPPQATSLAKSAAKVKNADADQACPPNTSLLATSNTISQSIEVIAGLDRETALGVTRKKKKKQKSKQQQRTTPQTNEQENQAAAVQTPTLTAANDQGKEVKEIVKSSAISKPKLQKSRKAKQINEPTQQNQSALAPSPLPGPKTERSVSRGSKNNAPSTLVSEDEAKDTSARQHRAPRSDSPIAPCDAAPTSRQKSLDLRVKVNGKQRRLTISESPSVAHSPRTVLAEEQPVTLRLPGQSVKLVWPEERNKLIHSGLSTSASSQRSESSIRGGHDMRSRQSSHTTVATSGALENKLQNMILSNVHQDSNANSKLETSEAVLGTIRPPLPGTIHHPVSPVSKGHDHELPFPQTEARSALANESISESSGVQVPAVPTLFEARPSQVHAPPFLGPPQPQNLPEQIPDSFGPSAPAYPNYHPSALPPSYPPVSYPHYYIPQQQFYTPYNQMVQPPISSFTDPYLYGNGTVYYSPDGTPIQYYPQQYYSPYQQQHYDY